MAAHCGHRGDPGGNIPFHRDPKLSLLTQGCRMVTQRWYRHFFTTLGSGEEDRITASVNASDVMRNDGKKGTWIAETTLLVSKWSPKLRKVCRTTWMSWETVLKECFPTVVAICLTGCHVLFSFRRSRMRRIPEFMKHCNYVST